MKRIALIFLLLTQVALAGYRGTVVKDSTDQFVGVFLRGDDDGKGEAGETSATVSIRYKRWGTAGDTTAVSVVDGTLGSHVDGGWVAYGTPAGAYQFTPPDAAFATGVVGVTFYFTATGVIDKTIEYELKESGVTLADDSIKAVTFDESTAFPTILADTGASALAREGGAGGQAVTLTSMDGRLQDVAGAGQADAVVAASYTLTDGTQSTQTFDETHAHDASYHGITAAAGTIDYYYEFNVTTNGTPTEIEIIGRLDEGSPPSGGDVVMLQAFDYDVVDWETINPHGFIGINGSTSADDITIVAKLFGKHKDTDGTVRIRLNGTSLEGGTEMLVDFLFVAKDVVSSRVGYEDGAIWFNDSANNTGTVAFVDGTADNPVSTWAAALALSANPVVNLKRFHIASGDIVLLSANSDGFTLYGNAWALELGGQSIEGAKFIGATMVTGSATATTTRPVFSQCYIGTVTMPPVTLELCGIGIDGGTFTAGSDGEYTLFDCVSMVPGSGVPAFVFTGLGSATGINNRRWAGGVDYTLDSDCTLSHEVLAGGGTTITQGGANVEVRGITRSLTLVLSGAGLVQFAGVVGPITLSGTATTTINLYGVSSSLSDSSVNTTVNDLTVDEVTQTAILADVTGINGDVMVGTDNAALAATALTDVTWTDAKAAFIDAAISDVPTVAEFNARSDLAGTAATLHGVTDGLIGALNDFNPASDTVANVDEVGTTTVNLDMVDAALTPAEFWAQILNGGVTAATMVIEVWAGGVNSTLQSSNTAPYTVTIYAEDGTTPLVTYTVSADGLTRTKD